MPVPFARRLILNATALGVELIAQLRIENGSGIEKIQVLLPEVSQGISIHGPPVHEEGLILGDHIGHAAYPAEDPEAMVDSNT